MGNAESSEKTGHQKMSNTIDIVILRFPHIAEDTFKELDNKSIAQCKIVSRTWRRFIEEQKFLSIRRIEDYVEKHGSEYTEDWAKIIEKSSKKQLKQIAFALGDISNPKKLGLLGKEVNKEYVCPLYIATRLGHLELFLLMTEKLEVTNPMVKGVAECNIEIPLFGTIEMSENIEATPLHFAALFGHLEICKIIAKKN